MAITDSVKKIAVGDVAHDAADAGNPIKIGGYGKATAPTAANADADRVNAWFDLNGRLVVDSDTIRALLPASLGQKAMAASLPVTIASDQGVLTVSQEVWPATLTPVRSKLSTHAGTLAGATIWQPASGKYARLLDVTFSTDTICALTLHQSTSAAYAAQVTADGAAHLWQLSETSGDAADSIGALTLTAAGSLTYEQASDICTDGTSILFDGSTGTLGTASKPATCTTGALEAWVYLPATLANDVIYMSSADTASSVIHMQTYVQSNYKPGFTLKDTTNRLVAYGNFILAIKTWYHIVWQHDGTGLECFVNGVSVPVTYTTGNANTVYWWDDIEANVDNFKLSGLTRSTGTIFYYPGRLQFAAWYGASKAASVWKNHFRLGAPVFGPHYFAANSGVAQALKTPLDGEIDAPLYATTSATASTTLEVAGYEL